MKKGSPLGALFLKKVFAAVRKEQFISLGVAL